MFLCEGGLLHIIFYIKIQLLPFPTNYNTKIPPENEIRYLPKVKHRLKNNERLRPDVIFSFFIYSSKFKVK